MLFALVQSLPPTPLHGYVDEFMCGIFSSEEKWNEAREIQKLTTGEDQLHLTDAAFKKVECNGRFVIWLRYYIFPRDAPMMQKFYGSYKTLFDAMSIEKKLWDKMMENDPEGEFIDSWYEIASYTVDKLETKESTNHRKRVRDINEYIDDLEEDLSKFSTNDIITAVKSIKNKLDNYKILDDDPIRKRLDDIFPLL